MAKSDQPLKVGVTGHPATMTHHKSDGSAVTDAGLPGKRYTRRFITKGSGSALRLDIAHKVAVMVAQDANTADYVRRYLDGDHGTRGDYIEYLENRIEFVMREAGFL